MTATGRVREVAPQADPVTRTFEVKVGLTDPPPAMRLGATVTGRMELDDGAGHRDSGHARSPSPTDEPAVWVVDPQSLTVSLRNVEVVRFDPATVVVSEGSMPGEIVVTAGVQALHPGPEDPPAGSRAVTRFNLSAWALEPPLVHRLSA